MTDYREIIRINSLEFSNISGREFIKFTQVFYQMNLKTVIKVSQMRISCLKNRELYLQRE